MIFGGGREHLTSTDTSNPEDETDFGLRQDGRNLINEWLRLDGTREYVWNKEQLDKLDVDSADYVMGCSINRHLGVIILFIQ